jgi:pimeloyl-ACP methyl ester carboxylesterase
VTTATELAGTFTDAGGIRTYYHDIGPGEEVVLLHGSGPGVSAWANWQHTIPALARTNRVLALDRIGYGATERPDTIRYSLRSWTDHVWAFLDTLGLDQVCVSPGPWPACCPTPTCMSSPGAGTGPRSSGRRTSTR